MALLPVNELIQLLFKLVDLPNPPNILTPCRPMTRRYARCIIRTPYSHVSFPVYSIQTGCHIRRTNEDVHQRGAV